MAVTDITLPAYLARVAPEPFDMGQMDCARFVAGWVEEITGRNPGAGHDYTAGDVAAIIRKAGGLRALGRKLAGQIPGLIETDRPRLNDVGVVRLPNGQTVFGICTGRAGMEWAVKTGDGVFIGPAQPLRCWTMQGGAAGAEAIGTFILSSLAVANVAVIGSVTLAQIVGSIVVTALSIGAQYALSTLMAPKGKDPGQQQQTVKSAIAPRVLHYGKVKTGGVLVFSHAYAGWWYNVIALGVGPLEFVELYLGDKLITLPSQPGPAIGAYGNYYVQLDLRAGNVPETVYTRVRDAFPLNWTNNHRGDGIASAMVAYVNPGQKAFSGIFQGGIPQFRAVVNGVPCFDPRTSTSPRSNNPALCILNYLTRAEGYNHPLSRIDMASFAAFATLCDAPVALKNGQSEPRYRLCGSIDTSEPRKDALKRMLDACDGQIYTTAEGKIAIRGGLYMPPEVTLDRESMVARNYQLVLPDATERANVIKPVFTSPQHDYQATEAASWRDEARIAREGEVVETLDLKLVPSHTQAQRLAKIAAHRLNAVPRGQLKFTAAALTAFEQPSVRIVDEVLGIDAPFEVAKFSLDIGNDALSVSIDAAKASPEAWDWDAATEEKAAPSIPATILESGTPVPENLLAFAVSAPGGVAFRLEFDPPGVDYLTPEGRFTLDSEPNRWAPTFTGVDGAAVITSTTVLANSDLYQVQARLKSFAEGAWCASVPVAAELATVAPDALASASVSAGAGQFTLTTVPGAETFALRIYTNTANDFATATRRTTRPAEDGVSEAHVVDGLAAGPLWIFAQPVNASGVAGPVSTYTANIT